MKKLNFTALIYSHERGMHNFIAEPAETQGEVDEFGYYLCRHKCGKTYKTKQGRNRYSVTTLIISPF